MKTCGIVVEYNPFHFGHLYQIQKIRQDLQVEAIIVVMSGNFVQRGEPAIIDKWARTEAILKQGVDVPPKVLPNSLRQRLKFLN